MFSNIVSFLAIKTTTHFFMHANLYFMSYNHAYDHILKCAKSLKKWIFNGTFVIINVELHFHFLWVCTRLSSVLLMKLPHILWTSRFHNKKMTDFVYLTAKWNWFRILSFKLNLSHITNMIGLSICLLMTRPPLPHQEWFYIIIYHTENGVGPRFMSPLSFPIF